MDEKATERRSDTISAEGEERWGRCAGRAFSAGTRVWGPAEGILVLSGGQRQTVKLVTCVYVHACTCASIWRLVPVNTEPALGLRCPSCDAMCAGSR